MATYSKVKLSGSTDGKGIKVAVTSIGSGTTIHTAQSGSLLDLITLFAINNDTTNRILTLGWGGTSSPDDLIITGLIPKAGLTIVVADLPLTNSLVVKAAADVANQIILFGYVNRIS